MVDFKLVIVHWNDANKGLNQDCFNEDNDIDDMVGRVTTTGFLYNETEKTWLLVQEFDGTMPRDYVVIPKCLITSYSEMS